MGVYDRTAMKVFGQLSETVHPYFSDIKSDLKKAGMKTSSQEYITLGMFTSFVLFCAEVVLLSYIFSLLFQSFLFGFITSFTTSIFLSIGFFYAYMSYPKVVLKEKAKRLESNLPFATLYLATIAGSKLPLRKTLQIFAKFS